MNEEMIQVHRVLGISDDRQQEISNEVMKAIIDSKLVDEAIKKLTEGGYDPESMLVGMRLKDVMNINNRMTSRSGMNTISRQNAAMN